MKFGECIHPGCDSRRVGRYCAKCGRVAYGGTWWEQALSAVMYAVIYVLYSLYVAVWRPDLIRDLRPKGA